MASVPYDLAQGKSITISNPMYVAAIGGDNPTPFYLNFPQAPPGLQWVFPYTYNFMIPFEPPQQVRVDASKTPPGYPSAPTSGALALLTAWDTAQLYNAGTRSAASSPTTQATVTGKLTVGGIAGVGGDTLAIPCGGAASIGIKLSAAIDATSQLAVEGTVDDVTWDYIPVLLNSTQASSKLYWIPTPVLSQALLGTATELWVACAGFSQIRVRLYLVGTGPITLTMRATPGALLPTPVGQQIAFYSQPVVIATDQPTIPVSTSGQPSGTMRVAPFNVQLAANGTLDLVAAVGGQSVYCLTLDIESNAAVIAEVNLQDDVPVKLATIRTDNLGWKGGKALLGIAGTVGHKVQLKNQSALTPTVAGELVFIQK